MKLHVALGGRPGRSLATLATGVRHRALERLDRGASQVLDLLEKLDELVHGASSLRR